MSNLCWPNGTMAEPRQSDAYGPRTPILTATGWTRAYHTGQDWISIGKLYAIGAGTVVESSESNWAGWQVLIDLGVIDGERTWVRYCHLAKRSDLRPGDTVSLGDFIGDEGSTGMVVGTHLHMEIYRGSVDRGTGNGPASTVDPRAFIRAHLGQSSEGDDMQVTLDEGRGHYYFTDEFGAQNIASFSSKDIGTAELIGSATKAFGLVKLSSRESDIANALADRRWAAKKAEIIAAVKSGINLDTAAIGKAAAEAVAGALKTQGVRVDVDEAAIAAEVVQAVAEKLTR